MVQRAKKKKKKMEIGIHRLDKIEDSMLR